jgi:hypothetical protein
MRNSVTLVSSVLQLQNYVMRYILCEDMAEQIRAAAYILHDTIYFGVREVKSSKPALLLSC